MGVSVLQTPPPQVLLLWMDLLAVQSNAQRVAFVVRVKADGMRANQAHGAAHGHLLASAPAATIETLKCKLVLALWCLAPVNTHDQPMRRMAGGVCCYQQRLEHTRVGVVTASQRRPAAVLTHNLEKH